MTELVEDRDYYVVSLEEMRKLTDRLNFEIEEWVVMPKEALDDLQGENVALMKVIIEKDL